MAYAQQKVTAGSWNTYNFVTTLQSGDIASMAHTRATANFQELFSNGYLTFSKTHEYNQFAKFQTPLTQDVILTILATHNWGKINQTDNNGATLAQVAAYGKNFALSNDPAAPTYYKFNTVEKETDMVYARLQAAVTNDLHVDNTAYTYSYINQTLRPPTPLSNQAEVLAGTYPTGHKAAPPGNKDVAGYDKLQLIVVGNILRVSQMFSFGEARGGLWYEISQTDRHRYDLDRTLGLPNPIEKAPVSGPVPAAERPVPGALELDSVPTLLRSGAASHRRADNHAGREISQFRTQGEFAGRIQDAPGGCKRIRNLHQDASLRIRHNYRIVG